MKFGVDYSWIRATSYFNNNTGGTFTFTIDRPFDANDLTTYPTQFTQNIGDPNLLRLNDLYRPLRAGQLAHAIEFHAQCRRPLRPRERLQGGDWRRGCRFNLGAASSGLRGIRTNDQKTVMRGGGGLYYSKVFLNITGNIMLARRFVGVTVINPGYPRPVSRAGSGATGRAEHDGCA